MNLIFRKALHPQTPYIIATFSSLHLMQDTYRNRVYESKESETLFNPTSSHYRTFWQHLAAAVCLWKNGDLSLWTYIIPRLDRTVYRKSILVRSHNFPPYDFYFASQFCSGNMKTRVLLLQHNNNSTNGSPGWPDFQNVHFPMNAPRTILDMCSLIIAVAQREQELFCTSNAALFST